MTTTEFIKIACLIGASVCAFLFFVNPCGVFWIRDEDIRSGKFVWDDKKKNWRKP